jgi:hypothetical protein
MTNELTNKRTNKQTNRQTPINAHCKNTNTSKQKQQLGKYTHTHMQVHMRTHTYTYTQCERSTRTENQNRYAPTDARSCTQTGIRAPKHPRPSKRVMVYASRLHGTHIESHRAHVHIHPSRCTATETQITPDVSKYKYFVISIFYLLSYTSASEYKNIFGVLIDFH